MMSTVIRIVHRPGCAGDTLLFLCVGRMRQDAHLSEVHLFVSRDNVPEFNPGNDVFAIYKQPARR
jgi:hypothetical protein